MFEAPEGGAVVRFADLNPTWNTMHAREAGYLRWVVSYYGGVEGQINDNPETGLVSDRTAAGMMWLAAGNRQFGVHRHTVAEIYVILRGRVESIEPGRRTQAGPLDCLYMPAGAPHAVRAIGGEDVQLLWCHDENETLGLSEYFGEDDERWHDEGPGVQVVRWAELQPRWEAPGGRRGGTLRWSASWAGCERGEVPIDPGVGAASERVGLGTTVLPPGNSHVPHAHDVAEHYVVVSGRAAVHGAPSRRVLEPSDYVGFAAGQPHALRAVGTEPLQLIWLQEGPAATSSYATGTEG
ncbi:MAG: cupin domain-containing protein [Solirubrobacterales bacterium]